MSQRKKIQNVVAGAAEAVVGGQVMMGVDIETVEVAADSVSKLKVETDNLPADVSYVNTLARIASEMAIVEIEAVAEEMGPGLEWS